MKAINLVPRDARRSFGALQGLGLSTTALFGALALAVVVVAGYVVLSNGVNAKRNELALVQSQQTATTREVARLKPYADLEQLRTSLLERVKTVAGSRYDWPGTLARIARAFPADAKLTNLDGAPAGDQGGPAIKLSGCTASHDAVARLIDRLRAVKGVAGVALASSKVDEATAGSSSGSGSGGGCDSLAEKFDMNLALDAPAGATTAAATPGAAPTTTPAAPAPAATGGTQ
jgi:Tfp pilus assembly protein PilN